MIHKSFMLQEYGSPYRLHESYFVDVILKDASDVIYFGFNRFRGEFKGSDHEFFKCVHWFFKDNLEYYVTVLVDKSNLLGEHIPSFSLNYERAYSLVDPTVKMEDVVDLGEIFILDLLKYISKETT